MTRTSAATKRALERRAAEAREWIDGHPDDSVVNEELAEIEAAIVRANQDSVAINSPALAEQPEAQANAASWPGKKAKAKEQGT